MSRYTPLELIKRRAKSLHKDQGIPLNAAQQAIAHQFNFNNFHELQKVAGQHPVSDSRLLLAAFGVIDLQEVIWEDGLHVRLDQILEDQMNGEIAETNAWGFSFEDLDIEHTSYDENIGRLTLTGSLTYSGYQDEDRVFHGSAFYLDVQLNLLRRDNKWIFDEENGVEILHCESDLDRNREQDDS